MIALLALAPCLPSTGFSCPPTALENLRPKLTEFLEADVRIAPELKNEVVVIEAPEATPAVIKQKLADILCGQWEVGTDGTLRLMLDEKEEERRRQASIREQAKAVELENIQLHEQLDAESLGTPDKLEILAQLIHDCEDVNRAYANFPLARIATELYLDIPPELLASVRFGGKREFSTRPASGQIDLGNKARVRLKKAISDNRRLYTLLQEMKWTESLDNPWMESLTADLPDDAVLDIIIGRDGHQIDAGLHHGSMTSPMEGRVVFPVNIHIPIPQSGSGHDNQSDGTEVWSRFSKPLDLSAYLKETFDSGKVALNDQIASEPLSAYTQGFFAEWSRSDKMPLIGRLSDRLFWPYLYQRENLSMIWQSGEMKAAKRDGWIELRPLDDRDCRLERIDRDALQSMARAIQKGKLPSISEQLADQDWLRASTRGSMAVAVMVGGVLPSVTNHIGYGSECFAQLSSGTRKLIAEGGRMSWQSLPQNDRNIIEQAVKNEDFMNREILRNGAWGSRQLFAFTMDEDSPCRFWENLDTGRAVVWAERTPFVSGQIVLVDEPNHAGMPEKRLATLSAAQVESRSLNPIGWTRNEEAVLVVQISETHRVRFRLPLWEGEFKTKQVTTAQ